MKARLVVLCCAFLIGAIGFAASVLAKEPAKTTKPSITKPKPADKKTTPQSDADKDFEGLGFTSDQKREGKGRTSLFGLAGEGYKFVYVFDRSGSMGGEGRESLKAVKAELAKSLEQLDTVHQFQIIFYNEQPVVFNPTGTAGRLAFATEANKERATKFLDSISATGGTDHEEALRVATRMRPDVIFFLTDGDEPGLSEAQLAKVRDMAAGTIVNCIEFGPGPKAKGTSFLETLAKQNGGGYVYIDITKRKVEK